jgi:hypothetical protein
MGHEINVDSIRDLEEQIEGDAGDIIQLKRTRNSSFNISTHVPPEILGSVFAGKPSQMEVPNFWRFSEGLLQFPLRPPSRTSNRECQQLQTARESFRDGVPCYFCSASIHPQLVPPFLRRVLDFVVPPALPVYSNRYEISLIIGGGFDSTPDSSNYEYLFTGSVPLHP